MNNLNDNNDQFCITQVNKIIKMLPDESFSKIPMPIKHFFSSYSDPYLEQTMNLTPDMVNQSLPENTLKYLKVVNYYINDRRFF